MLGKHALEMLSWTRYRTRRILDALPASFIHEPIKSSTGQTFFSPTKILEHIAWAEKMYLLHATDNRTIYIQDFTFEGKPKSHILNFLDETRKGTTNWLEDRKDVDLNDIMFNKRTHMGWVFHHLPEHEAHHVGQIVMLALIAGLNVPNV